MAARREAVAHHPVASSGNDASMAAVDNHMHATRAAAVAIGNSRACMRETLVLAQAACTDSGVDAKWVQHKLDRNPDSTRLVVWLALATPPQQRNATPSVLTSPQLCKRARQVH